MADSSLDIIVNLINKASAEAKALANDMKRTFGKVRGSFEEATKASKRFSIGILALGGTLATIATTSVLTAARTETLGVAMKAVAKSTKTSMKELKKQEDALKKQGITTQEARVTLTRFMQSQLDVTKATQLARVAQDLAVISGENSSVMTARLTDAIATMNPMLLRQAGIVTTANAVFKKYADTHGKSVKNLTDVEKKQALLNLILKEGEKVAGTYEAAMETAGKKMGSLARYFEEAKNVIGEKFLPVFGKAIDLLTAGLKQITPENIEKLINFLKENQVIIYTVLGGIAGAMGLWAKNAAAAAAATLVAIAPFAALGAAVGFVVYQAVSLVKNFKIFWGYLKSTGVINNFVAKVKGIGSAIYNAIKSGFSTAIKYASSWAKSLASKFTAAVKKAPIGIHSRIKKAINKAINDAVNWGVALVTKIAAGIKKGWNFVKAMGAAFFGKVWSMAKSLFGFQHGGVVPGPIGKPQLAVVHGGETVLPTHKPEFRNRGATSTVNQTFNVNVQSAFDWDLMMERAAISARRGIR